MNHVSRRKLVKTGLGVIAAPAILNIIPVNAQSRVIKIGHVSPRTGPLAGFGEADNFIIEQVKGIRAKGLERRSPLRLTPTRTRISGSTTPTV